MSAGVEAVIISGKRKGDLVELATEEIDLADLRSMLRVAVEAANDMAAEAKALRLQTDSFVRKVTRKRGRR